MCTGNHVVGNGKLDILNNEFDDDSNFDINCSYSYVNEIKSLNDFSVLHLNIRSLPKHMGELHELLDNLTCKSIAVDVILLCETWLNDNNSLLTLPGYQLYYQNRLNAKGGGTALYIKDNIIVEELAEFSTIKEGCYESKFIKLKNIKRELYIGEIYRVPNSSSTEFNLFIRNILGKLSNKQIIIGADQNLDLLKHKNHKQTEEFLNLLMSRGLVPCITNPTRITHQSSTLIDNIYTNIDLAVDATSSVLIEHISDHFPCLVQFSKIKKAHESSVKTALTRKLNEVKVLALNHELLHKNWIEELDLSLSADNLYGKFVNILSGTLDKIAPLKKCKVKSINQLQTPWMTVSLLKCSKKLKRLYREGINAGKSSKQWLRFVSYRGALNRLKRIAKKDFFEKEIASYKGNCKKIWNLLNSMIKGHNDKTSIIAELIVDGKKLTDSSSICNSLNKHFSSIGKSVTRDIDANPNAHKQYLRKRNTRVLLLSPATELEIEKVIASLPLKNSRGLDNLSNILICKLKFSIRLPLMILVNKSFYDGVFPKLMKIAKVYALHKGGLKSHLDNYRPISLLSVLSKMLEKVVQKRITKFFDEGEVLYDKQFGFRKSHSTVNAVQQFIGEVVTGFDKNFKCLALFLDLRKAFDVCRHDIILSKLEHYGVRDVALSWFCSYLSDREQFVELNGLSSDRSKVDLGIPQGSILGPLLMSVMVNDIKNCLKLSDCLLFADDTTLYLFGQNSRFLHAKMQREVDFLSDWLHANFLVANLKKTKSMLICPKSQNGDDGLRLKFDGVTIERIDVFKFLGIWIDKNLTWDYHVSQLTKALVPFKYLLSKLSFLPNHCLRNIYFEYIHSRLIYGLSVWGPMLKRETFLKLEKLQKSVVRIVNKADYLSESSPLFLHTKILKFSDVMSLELLKIMYLFRTKKLPNTIMSLFEERSHAYGTRNYNVPKVKAHKSTIFNSSFLCKSVSECNSYSHLFPESLPSLKTFCKNFKYERLVHY